MTVQDSQEALDAGSDERLRALKRRFFAVDTASVPRLFLTVLERSIPQSALAVGASNAGKARHSVFWLHGASFGAFWSSGSNDDSNVQIDGAIWPLTELTIAKLRIEPLDYDPESREVTRWTRRVTITIGGEELHFDTSDTHEGTDRVGDFIDSVLHAMAKHPPSRS